MHHRLRRTTCTLMVLVSAALSLAAVPSCGLGLGNPGISTQLSVGSGGHQRRHGAELLAALRFQAASQRGLLVDATVGGFSESHISMGRLSLGYNGALLGFRGGLGVAMKTRGIDQFNVYPTIAFRFGRPQLHMLFQLWDSALVPSPSDIFFAGVGGRFELGDSGLATTLGVAVGEVDRSKIWGLRAEALLTAGLFTLGASWLVGASEASKLGSVFVVAVGLRRASAKVASGGAQDRPVPVPAQVTSTKLLTWPQVDNVLAPGRTFMQKLGPLRAAGAAPMAPVLSMCQVDEAVFAGGLPFVHMTCDVEPPADGPTSWRSGCYVTRRTGIWRLARCPSADNSPPGPPKLVVPSRLRPDGSRFATWSVGSRHAKTLRISGQPTKVICQHFDFDRPEERCVAQRVGLVWAAKRWPPEASVSVKSASKRPPERAMVLVAISEGRTTGRKHLQFRESQSAACEVRSQCWAFGQCARRGGQCVAATRADCAGARVCHVNGHCTALAGACVAGSEADCRKSDGCRTRGECVHKGHRCVRPVGPATPMPRQATRSNRR
ncbi:MAG: hypothetical protein KC502_14855 [Myxococcales bacterium]|nr:hypothetical protein [Myxococcales bacterium]